VIAGCALGDDIADGPRQRGHQYQQEARERGRHSSGHFVRGQERDPGRSNGGTDEVLRGKSIAQIKQSESDREEHLHLDDE
jgi:hypothetical protein